MSITANLTYIGRRNAKWGCLIASTLPWRLMSSATTASLRFQPLVWKVGMRSQIGTKFHSIRHFLLNANLESVTFSSTKAHRHRQKNSGRMGLIPQRHFLIQLRCGLLLSEEFFDRIEWAMNTFFEQEIGGDRGREWGIANSIVTPIGFSHPAPPPAPPETGKNVQPVAGTTAASEDLKAGIEFQFRSFSDSTSRGIPYNSFIIGPTAAWRANSALAIRRFAIVRCEP